MRLALPSGRYIQAYGLSDYIPTSDHREPDWGLYLDRRWTGQSIPAGSRHVDWPDMGLPTDEHDAFGGIGEAWSRAGTGQVIDIACDGGTGRTGTAVACCLVADGLSPDAAIEWTRLNYDGFAVETDDQERLVRRFEKWFRESRNTS